jgi:hypothetical protein
MNPAVRRHPGELELRRLLAGESVAGASAHLIECTECKARMKGFEEDRRRFEAEIPFERFAAGIERATRQLRATPRADPRPLRVAIAAAAALVVVVATPLLMGRVTGPSANRLKGGSEVVVVVSAGVGGTQRHASTDPQQPEALAAGERVRIGVRAGALHYFCAVSIDEAGEVTAIHPAQGMSLRLQGEAGLEYFDSLEFTGPGLERVVVLLTAEPLEVGEVKRALRARYDEARGKLSQLGTLDLPGEQFHRTFLKP